MRNFLAETCVHAAFAFCFLGAGGYWISVMNDTQILDLKPILVGVIGLLFFVAAIVLYKKPAK